MSAVRSVWFALALGLLFLIPAVPSPAPASVPPTAGPDFTSAPTVRIQIPGAQAASLGPDVQIVEKYDTFVVARATAGAVQTLSARGLTIQPEDTFSLHVNGYAFDTREPVRVPAALAAPPVTLGYGYYLVQFDGPIKEDWRWQAEGVGLSVEGYLANNAYVVRASPAEIATVRLLPQVQWTGTYHPAFRIAPDLLSVDGLVAVEIITFADEPVGPVVATLNKMGYPFIGRFAPGAGILEFGSYDGFGLVRARIDAAQLVPLARLNGVRYIEPYEQMHLTNSQEQFVLQTNATAEGPGVRRIWDMGIRGDGQTIGVSDTGLDYDHTQFRQSQTVVVNGDIYNTTSFARRKVVRYLPMSSYVGVDPWTTPQAIQDSGGFCGGGHGTSTAGAAGGNDSLFTPQSPEDGMAPSAKLVEMDIGSTDASCADALSYIPSDYGVMYGAGYASLARIFSNSWGGASSNYDLGASMVDRFVWNNPDALLLFANGNNPPNALVGSPATAKDDVSVGAACSWNNREASGNCGGGGPSRGPTADGRMKPDISTFFFTSGGTTALSDGDLTTLNSGYTGFGGTSYATPLAAGMAALARQYFLEGWYPRGQKGGVALPASAALMKATLAASSVQMIGSGSCPASDAHYPNIVQGWGRLWLDNGLYFGGDTKKLFAAWGSQQGLSTGDTVSYKLRLASGAGNLRVMLAWSDYPGLEGANPALVNNLDLDVFDPSGTEYKGNVQGTCAQGQTTTGGSFDTLNSMEGVVRTTPATGVWTFNVIGGNIPFGPQRFALVVLADLDRTYGVVELDKTVYSETDRVGIQVTDNTTGPVTVTATSNTEPAGETVTLNEPVPTGNIWRGSINTAYGVPVANGKLEVTCGDTITVTYNDNNPPHASVATARVDCDYPVISNVRVTGISNSAATVQWTTDKPANSTVFFGTTASLGTAASDSTATTNHAVTLIGLTTETVYYFDVASTRGGHTTRDTNAGRHYTFKTAAKAEILLVVGDTSFPAERVSMDRDALARASWAWNEWNVPTQGDPPLTTLQQYKAILWETGLEQYPPIPDATATLLKTYIDSGGRMFLDGHDIGWAACDGGSSYATAARCNFVKGILKFNYNSDPQTVAQERGFANGNQISEAYTGGVPYVPHRTGGAADEGTGLNIGGATTNVWQTTTGDVPPFDGFEWISSAFNGTANPGCIWCGTPSRVAFFAFEFTGINFVAGVYNNAARTDILNKTIVWLLGRAPPIVTVVSPNGGETITTNTLAVTWAHSAGLASQEIWYSQDAGQSWFQVKTIAPANTTDSIDIGDVNAWPNGNQYMIRVVVTDIPPAGQPAFSAQDASNNVFTINRAGGDVIGPIVRAGSLRVSPNPAKNNVSLTINATIDDTLTGNSNINTAEYFIQAAMPTPGQYGTGITMNATNPPYDSPLEAVTTTIPRVSAASGSVLTIWVHGRDAATPTMNWGSFGGGNSTGGSKMIVVIAGASSPPPNPVTAVTAALVGVQFRDVRVSWQIPSGPAIDKFQVYFATVYDATKTGYALLADNIAPTSTFWDHANGGSGDANNYFYYVRAVNLGGGANSVAQAAKFTRGLSSGWNLISIPLTLQDTSIATTLQTLTWRTARTYVAGSPDPWRAWSTVKNSGDLRTVSAGMALWVDVQTAKDWTVAGQVPTSTRIDLVGGTWNFVGYASFTSRPANVAFPAGLGVNQLETYLGAPLYYLQRQPLTTNLDPGRGYWVYATTGGAWTVTN